MCLILFSWDNHAEYKLVLTANRDEFYKRSTEKAHFWQDYPQIFAGKDLEAGGTWMGINKTGKFAAITNYRDLSKFKPSPYFTSRGTLIAEYLKTDMLPEEYLGSVNEKSQLYDGFNLLVGDFNSLFYYSNVEKQIKQLSSGIYGLSNHLLNSPWPKVKKGKKLLSESLSSANLQDEKLLNMLYNVDHAEVSDLPDTGVGVDFEKQLSPMFIKLKDYGTRSSTLLKISKKGDYTFLERTFEQGHVGEEVSMMFNIFRENL